MSKHLHWLEDDRICHLPDTEAPALCPGCCNTLSPKEYAGAYWECIFKYEHSGDHCDIWGFEWNDGGIITKRPRYNGRCYNCGDIVPYDGMNYCGKACAALDNK